MIERVVITVLGMIVIIIVSAIGFILSMLPNIGAIVLVIELAVIGILASYAIGLLAKMLMEEFFG